MPTITAHCIVKNEENFVGYAIRSVVDFVDQVLVFDTGSTDKTVEIISKLAAEYPAKIIFEEKGACDKQRHTELRQEMLERTTTDWFMILDGDEVWTNRGMEEVMQLISGGTDVDCLIAPFYLCVGDLGHSAKKTGSFELFGKKGFFSPRVLKMTRGIAWQGAYDQDAIVDGLGDEFPQESTSVFLQHKYWHLSHLRRSPDDGTDYSSGGLRKKKIRETYFYIGTKINEALPEVFDEVAVEKNKLRWHVSFKNFIELFIAKAWGARRQFSKYFVTGVSALILDILSLFVFKEYFGMRPVVAVIVNQAILLNYVFLINKFWSFGARGMGHRQAVRFYVLAGCNYLFSVAWMWLINERMGVYYLLARMINIALAVTWNFLLYKFWVYKTK